MGQTNYKPRKATFTVEGKGKERIFAPVNRRAHIVAKKLGKRTRVTVEDIRKAKSLGSYRLYFYDKAGALKPVSVGK